LLPLPQTSDAEVLPHDLGIADIKLNFADFGRIIVIMPFSASGT
jgi:hypothetical protein